MNTRSILGYRIHEYTKYTINTEYMNTRSILEYRIHEYTKHTRIQNTRIHGVYYYTEYMNT